MGNRSEIWKIVGIVLMLIFGKNWAFPQCSASGYLSGKVLCDYETGSSDALESTSLVLETGFSGTVSVFCGGKQIASQMAFTNRQLGVVLDKAGKVFTLKLEDACISTGLVMVQIENADSIDCFELNVNPEYRLIFLNLDGNKLEATYSNDGRNYK